MYRTVFVENKFIYFFNSFFSRKCIAVMIGSICCITSVSASVSARETVFKNSLTLWQNWSQFEVAQRRIGLYVVAQK